MTFDQALATGARWFRRIVWPKNRWAYLTRCNDELVGVPDKERTATDWVVSHKTPDKAVPAITAPVVEDYRPTYMPLKEAPDVVPIDRETP